MAIEFRCSCGQLFRITAEHSGRRARCTGCGELVAIPDSAHPAGSPPELGRPPARPGPPPLAAGFDASDISAAIEPDDDALNFTLQPTKPPRRRKRLPRPAQSANDRSSKKSAPARLPPEKVRRPVFDEESSPRRRAALLALFGLLALAGLGGLGFTLRQKTHSGPPAARAAARKYAVFKHDLGIFSIEYPTDWRAQGKGGSGGVPPGASFEGDDAVFRISASPLGASIGTIAQVGSSSLINPGGDTNQDSEDDPVEVVHRFQRKRMALEYSNYEESASETIDAPGLGTGRMAQFSGKSGMFSSVKGFRATFLATDYQFNIVCYAPASQFEQYAPVFRDMIASFHR